MSTGMKGVWGLSAGCHVKDVCKRNQPDVQAAMASKVPAQSLDVAFCGYCRAFADGPL